MNTHPPTNPKLRRLYEAARKLAAARARMERAEVAAKALEMKPPAEEPDRAPRPMGKRK